VTFNSVHAVFVDCILMKNKLHR